MEIKNRPNPNEAFPNPNIPSLCFIKNVVKNPRIIIGDYTYYDDVDGPDLFEKHVTHFYEFIGDKLIIGKFCAIATAVPLKLKLEIKIVYRIPINLIMKYGIGALYSNQQMPHFKSVRFVERRRVLITRKLQSLSPFLTGH